MSSTGQSLTMRERMEQTLSKRYRKERRFRMIGLASVMVGLVFLLVFFTSIIGKGYTAFTQTYVQLNVEFTASDLDPVGDNSVESFKSGNVQRVVKQSLYDAFPEVTKRRDKRELTKLVSLAAGYQIQDMLIANPDLLGSRMTLWFPAGQDVDMLMKGNILRETKAENRAASDQFVAWFDELQESGRLESRFNRSFFGNGDSREPEMAGIRSSLMGSFYMLLVTLALSFPIGVAAAIYLEEFAPRNRWTDIIEVNINNLAAVPSIVFGLLGLAIFINWFNLPRSAPLVGGLVLTLLTLPVIIIAARAAIKSVPPSLREAALGLGASKMQMVFHHVLPLALPGILTGTIIGMARALGETAPLLMIGMVAFIVDVPGSPMDPSSALPVQIYLWADSPERAFTEKTSAAIIVLLLFLLLINLTAVLLRRKFERKW